jgi:hypothetical protein
VLITFKNCWASKRSRTFKWGKRRKSIDDDSEAILEFLSVEVGGGGDGDGVEAIVKFGRS